MCPVIGRADVLVVAVYWFPLLHYSLAIAPVLAMAAADGAGRVARLLAPQRQARLATVLSVAVLVATAGLGASHAFQPVPGTPLSSLMQPSALNTGASPATRDAARNAFAAIPADASVAASPNALPHLSHRRYVYLASAALPSADYVLQLGGDSGVTGSKIGQPQPPIPSSWQHAYVVVSNLQGVRLLHRRTRP
jgi:hypothetical protein